MLLLLVVMKNMDWIVSAAAIWKTCEMMMSAESKLEEFSQETEIKNVPLTVFDGVAGPRGCCDRFGDLAPLSQQPRGPTCSTGLVWRQAEGLLEVGLGRIEVDAHQHERIAS